MAKFEARGNAVFQLPEGGKFGFIVCECDNKDGNHNNQIANAKEIARCLNQDDVIQELIPWLLRQKAIVTNKGKTKILESLLVK